MCECRFTISGGPTRLTVDVALPGRVRRHECLPVSLHPPQSSDMPACSCRPRRPREVTWAEQNVASRDLVARHARSLMSPRTIGSRDTARCACRSGRASGAPGVRRHVAPHGCAARHGAVYRAAISLEQGDIRDPARRSTRLVQATCCGHRAGMHAAHCRFWLASQATS